MDVRPQPPGCRCHRSTHLYQSLSGDPVDAALMHFTLLDPQQLHGVS